MGKINRRFLKVCLLVVIDYGLVWVSFWLSNAGRTGEFARLSDDTLLVPTAFWGLAFISGFWAFGIYRIVLKHFDARDFSLIMLASSFVGLGSVIIVSIHGVSGIPRSLGFIVPVVMVTLSCGVRLAYIVVFQKIWGIGAGKSGHDAILYGLGHGGRDVLNYYRHSRELNIVCIVDDDRSVSGTQVSGLSVHHSTELWQLLEKYGADCLILAIPRIFAERRKQIIEEYSSGGIEILELPSVVERVSSPKILSNLTSIDMTELINPRDVGVSLGSENISGKVVLVTGAGGSIGSELCRQIAVHGPSIIYLVDHSEYSLYSIEAELSVDANIAVSPVLLDIANMRAVSQLVNHVAPDVIYHAAAYKHVPLVEANIIEGFRVNCLGTYAVVKAAIDNGVSRFTLISTDKAVRPTNVMGATKRLAEKIAYTLSVDSSVACSIVRFGNVIGSSGSVIPLFQKQIRGGGPVTITDPRATRFFMTIPEAVSLVRQASAMTKTFNTYVLDMGEPIAILDMAKRVASRLGKRLAVDGYDADDAVPVEIIGLRPGEKLHEELLLDGVLMTTEHPLVKSIPSDKSKVAELEGRVAEMEVIVETRDEIACKQLLSDLVEGYGNLGLDRS